MFGVSQVKDRFYINFIARAYWLHPVVARLNETPSGPLKERYREHWSGRDSELGKLALAIETKLSKLPAVVDAVNRDVRTLNAELKERRSEVDECIERTSGIMLRNEELGLRLAANIESFLYHTQSAYELVMRFLIVFSRRILDRRCTEGDIRTVLSERMVPTDWIDALREDRDLIAHETALWCDLRKTNDQPRSYEVLIAEVHSVDREHYRPLGKYTTMYSDFFRSLEKLREWLLLRIAEVNDGADPKSTK